MLAKNESDWIGNNGSYAISRIGYVHMALGIWLAKKIGVPFYQQLLLGKFLNLLLYVVLMFWTIRVIPIYKKLVTIMSLMPTPIVLATAYSYDPVVIGMVSLGSALIIKEYYELDKKINWYEIVGIPLLFFIGSAPKAVYIPMILCGLFLPKSKFKNKNQSVVWKILLLGVCALLVMSFVLPATGGQMEGDSRGGDTDVVLQLQLILQHPVTYAKILVHNVYETFNSYVLGTDSFASMAYLGIHKFSTLIALLVFGTAFTEPREPMNTGNEKSLRILKIVSSIMILGTVALIWTALYLSFTEVGSLSIKGVQGRYYIPLALSAFTVFYSDKIQVKWNRILYNTVLLLCILFIWHSCLYTGYLVPYCL